MAFNRLLISPDNRELSLDRRRSLDLSQLVTRFLLLRYSVILLTTTTTFVGLLPMSSEISIQAQFATTMALSLSFEIVFATAAACTFGLPLFIHTSP